MQRRWVSRMKPSFLARIRARVQTRQQTSGAAASGQTAGLTLPPSTNNKALMSCYATILGGGGGRDRPSALHVSPSYNSETQRRTGAPRESAPRHQSLPLRRFSAASSHAGFSDGGVTSPKGLGDEGGQHWPFRANRHAALNALKIFQMFPLLFKGLKLAAEPCMHGQSYS
ncbi:hypothetical protein LZ30DRAFT_270202 [Colletotrichum cereale]|nr:hypothetical protein LZ30DRAFT_270202 [Colletotrichum cereale]